MALVSGIAEAKIIEVKNEHIYNEASRSVQKHGWLPGLFRGIIQKAKELLQGLIRETVIPPKPTLSVDMAEYRKMQKLMNKVRTKPERSSNSCTENCRSWKSSSPKRLDCSRVKSVRSCRKRLRVYSRKLTVGWIDCPVF